MTWIWQEVFLCSIELFRQKNLKTVTRSEKSIFHRNPNCKNCIGMQKKIIIVFMCHKSKKFSILSVQFFFLEIWFLTNEHFSAQSQYVQKGPKSNKSEIKMSCNVQLPCFFAMAKIRRISHDHQAPFLFLLFLLLALQAWHEAKTSCHMHNTPRTPNIFIYSGPPIK